MKENTFFGFSKWFASQSDSKNRYRTVALIIYVMHLIGIHRKDLYNIMRIEDQMILKWQWEWDGKFLAW